MYFEGRRGIAHEERSARHVWYAVRVRVVVFKEFGPSLLVKIHRDMFILFFFRIHLLDGRAEFE